jgi:hypothetical protein
LHFFATSTLTADALSVSGAAVTIASNATPSANLKFLGIFQDAPKKLFANVRRWTSPQRIEDEKVLSHRRQCNSSVK